MNEKSKIATAFSPFPTVSKEGHVSDGILISSPRLCSNCRHKSCKEHHKFSARLKSEEIKHFPCERGVSTFVGRLEDASIVVVGVLDLAENKVADRGVKKALRAGNKISPGSVQSWFYRACALSTVLDDVVRDEVSRNLAILHDVKTCAGIVAENARSFISSYAGSSEAEKFDKAPDSVKRIYASSEMLTEQLKFLDIVANPNAADFGNKRRCSLVDLVYKLCKIFDPIAERKKKKIQREFSSYSEIYCFDSVVFIPLVMIDNALKYGLLGESITVACADVSGGVSLRVDSFGPVIPKSQRASLATRRFRSDVNSGQATGSGLGLYTAQIIASKHNAIIKYEALETGSWKGGIVTGMNSFSVVLPTSEPSRRSTRLNLPST